MLYDEHNLKFASGIFLIDPEMLKNHSYFSDLFRCHIYIIFIFFCLKYINNPPDIIPPLINPMIKSFLKFIFLVTILFMSVIVQIKSGLTNEQKI